MNPRSLICLANLLFLISVTAQTSPVSWTISATATETYSPITGSLSLYTALPQGEAKTNSFTATFAGTCVVDYTLTPCRPSGAHIILMSKSAGQSSQVEFWRDSQWETERGGSHSFSVTKGVTYYLKLAVGQFAEARLTHRRQQPPQTITGSAYGSGQVARLAGTNTLGTYRISWSGSEGGSRTITSFTFTPTTPEPRITLWPEPARAESGTVKSTFANTLPAASLLAPANNAPIQTATPEFRFSYTDPESDGQAALQLQISTNAGFSGIVFDSGSIASAATSFILPQQNALPGLQSYFWRVRVTDICANGQWSAFTSPWSFTNTIAVPGLNLHPADNAPPDSMISINEFTRYCAAWRSNAAWPVGPSPITMDYATRVGYLWNSDPLGYYAFTGSVANAPLCWVSPNTPKVLARGAKGFSDSSAVCSMTNRYTASVPITVAIKVTPATNVLAWAVEEQPPSGWEVANVSDGGVFQPVISTVKWGVFYGASPRTLTYEIIPAGNATSMVTFAGKVSFDGVSIPIGGVRQLLPDAACPSLLSAPVFSKHSGCQMTLKGPVGGTYILQASTNMTHWINLQTNINTTGTLAITDTTATNFSLRFYRAVSP
jgi:hypothetical protein